MTSLRIVILADPPGRLDKALARDAPAEAELSRSRLSRLIAEGAVTRAGAAVTEPTHRPAMGEIYEVACMPRPGPEVAPEAIPLAIMHEDETLLVVDKPAGMVVHPAPGSPAGTLVNALLHHLGGELSGLGGAVRPGIVHRIDKDTSGLLVVAKTEGAHMALARQFAAHDVERRYLAVCHGVPDRADPRLAGVPGASWEGATLRIATGLARHRTDRQRQAVTPGGRPAVTRAAVVERFGAPPAVALVECRLETGRTHQIRVHLAHAGHGLVGDATYGGRRRPSAAALPPDVREAIETFPRQALHAATLGFRHPVSGEHVRFEAALPPDLAGLLSVLRGSLTSSK